MEEKIVMEQNEGQNSMDNAVKKNILPYLKDLSVILTVILIAFLFCFRIAVVEGSSMYDTLIDGDYVLLLNSVLAGDPEYGDIIVVSKSKYKSGEPIIKRVIATEGQTVDIDFDSGIVCVDGVALDEPYIYTSTKEKNRAPLHETVQDGCLFVMGDNRASSLDSRNPVMIGQIDTREVVGKAIMIIFPGDNEGTEKRQIKRIGAIG